MAGIGARPSPATDLVVWLGLIVAIVGLAHGGTPPRVMVLSLIVVAATLALSLRWRLGGAVVVVLLLVGVALRAAPPTGFSDVLTVTVAAAREMLAGGAPYGQGFDASMPPGAPFAYGPLALLWYLPRLDDPRGLELLASFVILAALALRGRPLGLAVYAVTPAFVVPAGDGANDTTAGLLILVSLVVALRSPLAGAGLLALAVAFKPYALAWLPALIAYAGSLWPLGVFLAASALAWLPALVAWGAERMLWSYGRADEVHARPYYSLAYALEGHVTLAKPAWQVLRFGAGALLAALSLITVRTAPAFIIAGALVLGATLFLGWWGTFAYLAAVGPVICWHLDDWLGLEGQRIVWPGDPVGQVTSWLDRRWPILAPGRLRREIVMSGPLE